MFKSKIMTIVSVLGGIATFIAMSGASSASGIFMHQPKPPKCLK